VAITFHRLQNTTMETGVSAKRKWPSPLLLLLLLPRLDVEHDSSSS